MGLSCAAGRRPVNVWLVTTKRCRVRARWGRGGPGGWVAARGWVLSYPFDNMWCFVGDGGEGGGERTYSYSTAPHSDKWEYMVYSHFLITVACEQVYLSMEDRPRGTICSPRPCCDEGLFLSCQATTVVMNVVYRRTPVTLQ